MKKLLFISLLFLNVTAFSLPVGNPSDASLLCDGVFFEGRCTDPCSSCQSWYENLSLRLGFYGDYVFNRHMSIKGGEEKVIETVELFTNAGYLAINFWNRIDVFGTVGATNLELHTNTNAFSSDEGGRLDFISGTYCGSWSVGARATLWEIGCTTFGLEGQYFRAHPNIKRITILSTDSFYPDNFYKATYDEWQVGFGVAHRIHFLIPYLAVKYSRADWNIGGKTFTFGVVPFTFQDLENQKSWGYAVGVSLIDCEKMSLTVEGRFADEKALHVNGQIRF